MTTPAPEAMMAQYAERELLAIYRAANRATRRRGKVWYPTARGMMEQLAAETGYTLEQAVAVLAITSPGAQLKSNLDWTRKALETRGAAKVGRFPNAMRPKIAAVLADPDHAAEYVRGPKVGPFHRAILGDTDALVIDRWATAAGNPFRDQTLTDPTRRALETAYRRAAKIARVSVSAFQAIVWIAVRESTPIERHGKVFVPRLADITS